MPPVPRRRLGASPLQVAPLAFGGNVFGWSADAARSFELLDAFVDAGFNLIDTADGYSNWVPGHQGGESETIIGQWLKRSGKRDRVVIATKAGMPMGEGSGGLSPKYLKRALAASLKRLQVEYIDLYQAHRDDPETPLEDTLAAFAGMIEAGQVRVIGASNYSAARLSQALDLSRKNGLPRYETLQPEYSLAERRGYESELAAVVDREQLGVLTYFSLASGFLSGKYRSSADLGKSSVRGQSAAKYLNPRGLRILAALDDVAAGHRAKPAQVALAWLMAQPHVAAPIASATSVDQLGELLAAATLQLSAADLRQLGEASAEG